MLFLEKMLCTYDDPLKRRKTLTSVKLLKFVKRDTLKKQREKYLTALQINPLKIELANQNFDRKNIFIV